MPFINRQIAYTTTRVVPTIVPPAAGGADGGPITTTPGDNYASKLVKLVPSEVVAAYVAADSIIAALPAEMPVFEISGGAVLLGLILTPFYLWKGANVTEGPEMAVSTATFFVWALLTNRTLSASLGLPGWAPGLIAIGFSVSSPALLAILQRVWRRNQA